MPSSGRLAQEDTVVWSGSVRYLQNGSDGEDLCKIAVHIPKTQALEFHQHLAVAHIVQRRGIMLGLHHVCRTTIIDATDSQQSKLRSLAQHELVAVAPLDNSCLILVPYLDSCSSLRAVSFLLLL